MYIPIKSFGSIGIVITVSFAAMSANPGPQRSLHAESEYFTVSLRAEPCETCLAAQKFTFSVTNKSARTHYEFDLQSETGMVDRLYLVGRSRLVVIGRMTWSVHVVTTFDLDTGKMADSFLCLRPSLSPDGRRLAYIKMYTQHFVENMTSIYMVYDLEQTAAFNRAVGNRPLTERWDVGKPLYPDGAKNRPGESMLHDGETAHVDVSEFHWLDNNRLAFADFSSEGEKLVVADLSAGILSAKKTVYPLDIASLYCEGEKPQSGLRVSGLEEIATRRFRITLEPRGVDCLSKGKERIEVPVYPEP